MKNKYIKNFDGWNDIKKKLDKENRDMFFYVKEIWWCYVGINVGSENDGKSDTFLRPVYILKKINYDTFVGIPLTSNLREDKNYMSFYFNYDFSTAILSQIKTLDAKRLSEKMGQVSDYLHTKIEEATIAFLQS